MIFTFCLDPETKLPIVVAREIINDLNGNIQILP